ncbi:ATP-binding protein [Bifidobacterium cuniculi]|uniref:ATP-binding protein n=1 Tax=Bifidobacterium cuniculi TaxID=1688 RepID=A0A087AL44_9BIFI|nr:ATP-binding protein [Bifidobacterium cuniculi]KFI59494.1 ATP-binding protein [Bifidobacterium cuniculi]
MVNEELFAQIELSPAHWQLAERQLVNWGSYDGYHVFRPAPGDGERVTLLTGQSESGKSTLVDAQVSLLYPTGAAFNKASNAGRSDRSDYTYVRGLRGVRNDRGHDEPVYLRGTDGDGNPYAVWGAIVDTYHDDANDGTLSIAKFMAIPADGSPQDMVKLYAVAPGGLDPRLMDGVRDEPLTAAVLKRVYPDARVYRHARQFHEDVWRRFGLTESACRLLHRMQASDAPSQLDDIFRKGVLQEPRALQLGRHAVDDYGQYRENFTSIERNRERVAMLETMADEYQRFEEADGDVRALGAIDPMNGAPAVKARDAWLDRRIDEDLERMVPSYAQAMDAAAAKVAQLETEQTDLQAAYDEAREQLRGAGGGDLERLQEQLRDVQRERSLVNQRRERLLARFAKVGEEFPADAPGWQEFADRCAAYLEDERERRDQLDHERFSLMESRSRLREELKELEDDYAYRKAHGTRISTTMKQARELVMQATGLGEDELPYVAELMDIDDEDWRVAMDVAYARIAQVILVDRRHEDGFARKVSTIPHQLMARRNWQFVDTSVQPDVRERDGWLSGKLRVKESPFAGWVRERIAADDVDARCVQAIDDRDTTRQVQPDGQLKAGIRGSHGTRGLEPVIGFVTEEYLRQLEARIGQVRAQLEELEGRLADLDRQHDLLEAWRVLAAAVTDDSWDAVDVASRDARAAHLEERIAAIRDNPELAALEQRCEDCAGKLATLGRRLAKARNERADAQRALHAAEGWLAEASGHGDPALNKASSQVLAEAYGSFFGTDSSVEERVGKILAVDGGAAGSAHAPADGRAASPVVRSLRERLAQATRATREERERARQLLRKTCEATMQRYLERYLPQETRVAADVDNERFFERELAELQPNTISQREADREYFNSLDKVRQDLMQLRRALKEDRAHIKTQVAKINGLLERYPFGASHGQLRIVVQVRAADPKFMATLQRVIDDLNTFRHQGGGDVDRCRELFAQAAPLIDAIKGSFDEYAPNGRGNENLDPRRRSRFFGEVLRPDGATERINSTGGGSGGYLQELTSFAYGAALMYLLADDNATEPSYATVFLDEALIKADGQYTRRALSVLPGLGFQVIVSAPESKTAEMMGAASKVVVARKDQASGLTTLHEAVFETADGD